MSERRSGTRIRLDRVRIEEELTFAQAAQALGRKNDPSGRHLRNLVRQRERKTGRQIAIRLGGEAEPKLRVTLSALYRAFPECRPARTEHLAAIGRALIDGLDERIDERTESVVRKVLDEERLPDRVRRLESRIGLAESYLRGLAEAETGSPPKNVKERARTSGNRPTG